MYHPGEMPGRNEEDRGTNWPTSEQIEPPESFVEQANVSDEQVYERFETDWPDAWTRATDLLEWDEPFDEVLDDEGCYTWFDGGRLNACYNCVDRHLEDRKNQVAIAWEGHRDETRSYTYLELYNEVNEFAAVLRDLGVGEDDVVTMYMPMIPELPIAMLACARIGAPHSVVFAGFSADALAARMNDADSEYLVTCDGYYRRGDAVRLKNKADTASIDVDRDVTTVVVDRLTNFESSLAEGEYDYHGLLDSHARERVDPVERAADDDLFVIYTSGTTGEPKKVTHTTGGYLSYVAWTSRAVLDVKPEDTYWCSADIGWITGHSYIVYGPLALGTTTLMYEGAPDHPEKHRIWEIAERNAVDVFYTAPTAIRAFMKWGEEYPEQHDLSSLRLLGTVGEPINPRAWKWYYEHIGNEECPIVDTWWQTETGGMMITTLPAIKNMKPGAAGPPLPGIDVSIVDGNGEEVSTGEGGYLVVDRPWPGMPQELCTGTRWAQRARATGPSLPGIDWAYPTEDGALVGEDGYITILGRLDDVINVSGHRFGTMEIESAIVSVPGVAEAAVVGGDHDIQGNAIYAYVSPEDSHDDVDTLREEIVDAVEHSIGPIACPEAIIFTPELPKTQSGKIMRRLLENIANGEDLGDLSALRNPEVVGELETSLE
ncbi:MAG: acetyl-CoA synthetase [Haloarculaceae archaeon]|jgi:acetyl-CoA synthetase